MDIRAKHTGGQSLCLHHAKSLVKMNADLSDSDTLNKGFSIAAPRASGAGGLSDVGPPVPCGV